MEIVPSLLCIDSLGISIGVKEDDCADTDGADGAVDGVAIDEYCADDSDGNISDDESKVFL